MNLRLLFFLVIGASALAHDPGLSSALITIGETEAVVQVAFAPGDIQRLPNPEPSILLDRVVEWQLDGDPEAPISSDVVANEGDNIEFRLTFPRRGERAIFRSLLIPQLPHGHRQLLTVQDKRGQRLDSRLLHSDQATAEVFFPPPAGPSAPPDAHTSLLGFLRLGVEHILTGYDHLLFLCALLLVCRKFRTAVAIITCFTVAHSITLALATFDLVQLPSRIVEPIIAASIIYVGVENVIAPARRSWRYVLTFAFGLIHGLGFAGALREVGVGSQGAAIGGPLLAFNGGVELGQLAVAAIVLPLILHLRARPVFVRVWIPALSLIIVAAGAYWLIDRTLL